MASSSTNTSDLLELATNRYGFINFNNIIRPKITTLMVISEIFYALLGWKPIGVLELSAIGQRYSRVEVATHCIEIQLTLP